MDDGLRAGLFTLDELLAVPLIGGGGQAVRDRYPGVEEQRLIPELVRDQIGRMANDVLDETRRRLAASGVETSADVRRAGRSLAGFSEEMARAVRAPKIFLFQRLYRPGPVQAVSAHAEPAISPLFAASTEA